MRVFSAVQPSGGLHVGNLLGALSQFVELQDRAECYFAVADLHAFTVPCEPADLRARTLETASLLLAAGVRPDRSVIFVQSHVMPHTFLGWLLMCLARVGELERMTQFKAKGGGRAPAPLGLMAYPPLMAADILIYKATHVPVGEDQRQHVELVRRLARRFNVRFGETFPLPQALVPQFGARVMAFDDPSLKMSKSTADPSGTIFVLDSPDAIREKVSRAFTDSERAVLYDPENRPAVSNLLAVLSRLTGDRADTLAARYSSYAALKRDLAEALVAALEPIQRRFKDLRREPDQVIKVLQTGARRAAETALATLAEVRERTGLLPPGSEPGEP